MMMSHTRINIQEILPQAAPFILIDAVTDYQPGKSLTAVKNITANEWFFKNAGPMPYLPETLLIEAAAQTAVLFARLTMIENYPKDFLFVLGRINAEFEGCAGVGDQVLLKTSNFRMMKMNGFIDVGIELETGSIAKLNIFYSLMENKSHG